MRVPFFKPPAQLSTGLMALSDAYHDGHASHGPEVRAFEEMLEDRFQCHAIATDSCSGALEIVLRELALRYKAKHVRGPTLLAPALTWNATVNAVPQPLYSPDAAVGGIEFWDVDERGIVKDPRDIYDADEVLLVRTNLYGNVSYSYGFEIEVVDGAQSFELGCDEDADATCLSFGALKSVPAGSGGAVLTRDSAIASELRAARHHGIDMDASGWDRMQKKAGNKHVMQAPIAAMCAAFLPFVDEWHEKRRELCDLYASLLDDHVDHVPLDDEGAHHAFVVLAPLDVDELQRRLASESIATMKMYTPLVDQPFWQKHSSSGYNNARSIGRRALALPLHTRLTDAEVRDVAEAVKRCC